MKYESVLLGIVLVIISEEYSWASSRNEFIGSCSYSENYTFPRNDIVKFLCSDSVRPNNIFPFREPFSKTLNCVNKRKWDGGGQAGTILFENCQMSRIKYNISEAFTHFHTLNVSSIELQYLPNSFFIGASQLQTLIASNNRLLEIPSLQFFHCPSLRDVDYSYNRIGYIETDAFGGCNTIKKLNLSHNHLTALPPNVFAGLSDLQLVDLSHNSIQNLVPKIFAHFSNLVSVNLSHNDLKTLAPNTFLNLSKLELLNLSYNNITDLPDTAIMSQPNLQFVQLSHNNLTIVEMATFAHQENLVSLDLSYNSIRKIDFNATRMKHIERFHINENRLQDLDGFKNLLFPSLNEFSFTGNKFNCSYLRIFLSSFNYHSSVSVLHRSNATTTIDDDDGKSQIHGVNCYNYSAPTTSQPPTESVPKFSSTERAMQSPASTTRIDKISTSQDVNILSDSTVRTNATSYDSIHTKTLTDHITTSSQTIKHLLIVLVALNIGVALFKVIRNRNRTASITSATNYNCGYNTESSPNAGENLYETNRRGSSYSFLLNSIV